MLLEWTEVGTWIKLMTLNTLTNACPADSTDGGTGMVRAAFDYTYNDDGKYD